MFCFQTAFMYGKPRSDKVTAYSTKWHVDREYTKHTDKYSFLPSRQTQGSIVQHM